MNPDPLKPIEIEDNGKVTVPESRIGSAADARTIISALKRAESTRSTRRASINGCANGNPPWGSPAAMKAAGRGEGTNVNFRQFEGFVAAAKTPYYDLLEVDQYAVFSLDYPEADKTRLREWEDRIACRYHETLDDWDGMDMNFQRSQYQMVVHGAGPMMWEDARDWRSKSRMAGQILVPDDASAEVEEWDQAGVPRSYLPSVLWKIIQKEASAKAAGWNVPAVRLAIMRAAPEDFQKSYGNAWEMYEAEIRKGSAAWNNKSSKIYVADLLQKEYSGKISHFIVVESESVSEPIIPDTTDPKDPNAGFLFRKIGRFDCFTQILTGFLYDVGDDGQWHSVKGAGPKILDFCKIKDRLLCKMVDGANLSSGLVLRPKNVNALQQTSIKHISGGTVLHPDYEVMDNRMSDNLKSPLLVMRELDMRQYQNTSQYRARPADQEPFPTLGQEQMNAAEEAVLSRSDINRYYRFLNRWHRETFRRLLLMGKRLYDSKKDVAPSDDYSEEDSSLSPSECGALKFYRGCVKDGVPADVLDFKYFRKIRAKRALGYGSAQMRMMIGEKLLGMVPMADERGRNFAQRNYVTAFAGQDTADAMFPRYDTPRMTDAQISLATLENNVLRMPSPEIAVDPEQNHVVHFQIHDQGLTKHAQEVQAGQGDPMALMVHFDNAGPHMHEHLMHLQGDPTRKAQFDAMMEQWQARSKQADQLRQQLEEAQAAAAANQPQQQPDPQLIAAMAKVQGELEIKRQATFGKLALQSEKQKADLKRKDVQTAANIRLEKFKTLKQEPVAA